MHGAACATAAESRIDTLYFLFLQVLLDEGMEENARMLGELLRHHLKQIPSGLVASIRGKGLLNAIVINESSDVGAWEVTWTISSVYS